MTNNRDFIDELTDYAAKMRQEYTTIDDVLEQAVEHQVKVRVARKLLVEAEHGRLQFSNALRPFLPERLPVPLRSDPGAIPQDMLDEPYENPRFMQSDLPPHEVGLRNE
jgi:hypothetical protein